MDVIAHFIGGPKDGELQRLSDTTSRTVSIAVGDGTRCNYELQILVVADEKIWVFAIEGMSPDQTMIGYLENCRIRG